MTLPLPLPDWLPWWAALAAIVLALLFLLAFLTMPFSVFGLKGRLDLIEMQLDEIQAELRRLAARPPAEPSRYAGRETPPEFGRAANQPERPRRPAPVEDAADRMPLGLAPAAAPPPPRRQHQEEPPERVEPRLDWPPS